MAAGAACARGGVQARTGLVVAWAAPARLRGAIEGRAHDRGLLARGQEGARARADCVVGPEMVGAQAQKLDAGIVRGV